MATRSRALSLFRGGRKNPPPFDRARPEVRPRPAALRGDRTRHRDAQRRDAVHEVELSVSDTVAEMLRDQVLETWIRDRTKGLNHGPAVSPNHAQQAGKLPKRLRKRFRVDCREVAAFHRPRAQDRVTIADLRHEMHVIHVALRRR